MYKRMTPVPWLAQMRMTGDIIGAQVRHYLPGSSATKRSPETDTPENKPKDRRKLRLA
jgi:hypothetical protein